MDLKKITPFLFFLSLNLHTFCQSIKVAAAANLQSVITVLGADFKNKTGITVEPIMGSSGNLVGQIKNGAPFDVFLSADMSFPDGLYQDGFAVDKPVVYASGSLIVCSTLDMLDLTQWQALLTEDQIVKIAIGNPSIAPYGKAAKEVFDKIGVYSKIKQKLVLGESISQVNTYILTNVVNFGFTTQSFLYDAPGNKNFNWAPIDPRLYSPIQQGMVIIKHANSPNYDQAQKFYNYLLSSSAKSILKKYGYK